MRTNNNNNNNQNKKIEKLLLQAVVACTFVLLGMNGLRPCAIAISALDGGYNGINAPVESRRT